MSDYNYTTSTALRAIAADLGAKAATRRVALQGENAVKIPYILKSGAEELLERRYGFAVISDDKDPLTTDHPMEAIDRAVCRSIFSKIAKPDTTKLPTIYLGSGGFEVSRYYKNRQSHFWAHNSEGKDAARERGM